MPQLIDEYIRDAVAIVSAWDDVPDDEFADTVNAQAQLMAGVNPDDAWHGNDDSAFSTHR